MLFMGIVWNPAYKYLNDIKEITDKYAAKVLEFSLDLKDTIKEFIEDIYLIEDTPKWKIQKKIETMLACEDKKVRVIFFDIDNTHTYYHEKKNYMVYTNAENMKTDIRNICKQKIENYFFDNTFHMTDNNKELKHCIEIVNKYLNNAVVCNNEQLNYLKMRMKAITLHTQLSKDDHVL